MAQATKQISTNKVKQETSETEKATVFVGNGGELHQTAIGDQPVLTTNQDLTISDNQNSLKAHPQGPTLLEDSILREK